MGQKVHPISLRLEYTNRNFDNNWYSDYFYSTVLLKDLYIQQYLNTFFKFLKLPSARFCIQHLPKKTKLYTFFCYPKHSRELRSRYFQITSKKKDSKKKKKYTKNTLTPCLHESSLWFNFTDLKTKQYIPNILTFSSKSILSTYLLNVATNFQKVTLTHSSSIYQPVISNIGLIETLKRNATLHKNFDIFLKNIYINLLYYNTVQSLKNTTIFEIKSSTKIKNKFLNSFNPSLNFLEKFYLLKYFLVLYFVVTHWNKNMHIPSTNFKIPLIFATKKPEIHSDFHKTQYILKYLSYFERNLFCFNKIQSKSQILSIINEKSNILGFFDPINKFLEQGHFQDTSAIKLHKKKVGSETLSYLKTLPQYLNNTNLYKHSINELNQYPNISYLHKLSIQDKIHNINNNLKYKNYIQDYISTKYNLSFELIPIKVSQDWQNAGYFADEIVYFLEKRVPFRRIKNRILKQISENSSIRGIRITCSGRVGGKSKKAQRAKTECIKYGQTSLHVFTSRIDFAVRTAHTMFGSVGIKVWICYNS